MESQLITEIIPIVENGIINKEELTKIYNYYIEEIKYATVILRGINISTPTELSGLYRQINNLLCLDIELSPNILNKLLYKSMSCKSINPINEIVHILKRLESNTPENFAIVITKYKDQILGSISVTIDSRITYNNLPISYIIGIRKSAILFAIQEYYKTEGINNILTQFKLSNELLLKVIEYSKLLNAKYLISTPISIMRVILKKYWNFSGPFENTIKSTYIPAAEIIDIPEEEIFIRSIDY